MMTENDPRTLSPLQRIAGYLEREAKHAAIGAALRERGDDFSWTDEEQASWDEATDDILPWWDALSEDERDAINPVSLFFAAICRGEWPAYEPK